MKIKNYAILFCNFLNKLRITSGDVWWLFNLYNVCKTGVIRHSWLASAKPSPLEYGPLHFVSLPWRKKDMNSHNVYELNFLGGCTVFPVDFNNYFFEFSIKKINVHSFHKTLKVLTCVNILLGYVFHVCWMQKRSRKFESRKHTFRYNKHSTLACAAHEVGFSNEYVNTAENCYLNKLPIRKITPMFSSNQILFPREYLHQFIVYKTRSFEWIK